MFGVFNQKNKPSHPPYPDYPYSPPIKGLFHNQTPYEDSIAGNYTASGQYTVYIPDNLEPYAPAIMILPPNNISALLFLEGESGQGWRDLSDSYGIALVIAEAYQGGNWNVENRATLRDDDAYLKGVYDTIRDKLPDIPAVFDLDDKALYLVGYEQGGAAAHKFAMLWPQLFAGIASVDGGEVPDSIINSYGNKIAFPFASTQNSDGREALRLVNKTIPLPAWIITSSDITSGIQLMKNHWITAAQAVITEPNDYVQQAYENGAARIWATTGTAAGNITPEIIYIEFFAKAKRDISEPGGIMRWTLDYPNQNGKGFFFTETEVSGLIRRWITYIPSTYDENNSYPLVLAIHGGAATPTSFVWDSLWHETAEKYGLIVVFPHAYVNPANALGWMPLPSWNQYGLTVPGAADDVAFIVEVIAQTKQNYNVDTGRIFATGHSNGSGMTWRLGLDVPELFAAIAPAGLTLGSFPVEIMTQQMLFGMEGAKKQEANEAIADVTPLPVWAFMGRFDGAGADDFKQGSMNDFCLQYWGARNGFDPQILKTGNDTSGSYYIRTWTNGFDNIPIFRYATVANCPHTYVPSECNLIWKEFFGKITMDADSKRYFDDQEIVKANSISFSKNP
jgi:polyhydroxybutyrate depolymerase